LDNQKDIANIIQQITNLKQTNNNLTKQITNPSEINNFLVQEVTNLQMQLNNTVTMYNHFNICKLE